MSFSPVISGSGSLTKLGSGTLALSGSNLYTGTTTVSSGTLQLGDGTAGHDSSLTSGNIINNSAMVYDVGANQSYAGAISGSGNLIKTGPGRLVLAGSLNYSGKTLVTSGTLAFDGPSTGLYEGLVSNTNGADTADPIPKGSIQRVARWARPTASIPTTMPIRTSSPTGEIPRRGVTAATSITPAAARSRTHSAKILTMRRFSRSTASRSSAMVSTIRTPRPAFLWRRDCTPSICGSVRIPDWSGQMAPQEITAAPHSMGMASRITPSVTQPEPEPGFRWEPAVLIPSFLPQMSPAR